MEINEPQAAPAMPWRIDAWRWFPLAIGASLLAVATLVAQAPAPAVIALSVAGALLLLYGARLWWMPFTVAVPHVGAALMLGYAWLLGTGGALLGVGCLVHAGTAVLVTSFALAGQRALMLAYLVPALGIGVAVVQGMDLWIMRGNPLGIAPVVAVMAVQLVAISAVLRRVSGTGLALIWSLTVTVGLFLNERAWLHGQSELMTLREHLELTSGVAPGITMPVRADGITWGRDDARTQVIYVMSLDGDLASAAQQLQALLALRPEVEAGKVRVQCDVSSAQGHVGPMVVQAYWNIVQNDQGVEDPGRVMLERLAAVRPDTVNNMSLTFIGLMESARPGRPAAMDLAASAPALLDRLDRQALAHRSLGMTGFPSLVITRSTGAGHKPAILFRSTDLVAASALRSHL